MREPAAGAAVTITAADKPSARLPSRLAAVDALRGIAALAVLIFHANAFFWRIPNPPPTLPYRITAYSLAYGHYGVTLFFVISGFCIHLPYAGLRSISAAAFLVRRFWRLYPAYLATFLTVFALQAAQAHAFPRGQWTHLAGHFVFWHFTGTGRALGMGVTPVLWTVAAEVQFYVLYLLLRPLLIRVGLGRAAVVALAIDVAYHALLARYVPASGLTTAIVPRRLAPIRFGEWLLGAWLADVYARRQLDRLVPPGRRRIWLAAGLLLLALGIASESPSNAGWWNQADPLLALGFTAIAAALIAHESRQPAEVRAARADRLSARFIDWAATRSYSLYLVHFTALASVGFAFLKWRHIDGATVGGTRPWLLVTLTGVVGAFVAGELLYRFVEAPSHALARRLGRARAAERSPAVN